MVQKILHRLFLIIYLLVEISAFSITPLLYNGEIAGYVIEKFDPNFQPKKEGLMGVILYPNQIIDDVSFLSIGSCSKLFLAKELGNLVGRILSSKGYDFCISGRIKRLDKEVKDPWNYISSSSYMVASILENYCLGLISAGIFPVMDGRFGMDEKILQSFKLRDFFPPILLQKEQEVEKLKRIDYVAPVMIEKNGKIIFNFKSHPADLMRLDWKDTYWREDEIEKLREEILLSSVVLIKRTRVEKIIIAEGKDIKEDKKLGLIVVNDPFKYDPQKYGGVVVVFSKDEEVLKMAKDVLTGLKNPTGRRAW